MTLINKRKLFWVAACAVFVGVYMFSFSSKFSFYTKEKEQGGVRYDVLRSTLKTRKATTSSLSMTHTKTTTNKPMATSVNTTLKYEWEKLAENMDDVDDSVLRCKALYVGCFVPIPPDEQKTFIDIGIRSSSNTLENSDFKDICLDGCFKRDFWLAGINLRKKICHCSKTYAGFITSKGKSSAVYADQTLHCTSENTVHVYSKIRDCELGVSEKTIVEDKVACVKIPNELTGDMVALAQSNVTVKQCVLNCEMRSFTYAIPMVERNICVCSDSYSLFGTATEMLTAMKKTCTYYNKKTTKTVPAYRTVVHDTHCEPLRFFNLGQAPSTLLASFYGSGNTWIRHLIELATGVYTGSVYRDHRLLEGGMLGEELPDFVGRTVVVKDHLFKLQVKPHFRYGIFLVRNPYEATLAEYTRRSTQNHTGVAKGQIFRSNGFKNFLTKQPSYWFNIGSTMLKFFNGSVLVVYFEDVVRNPIKELRRIVEFLPEGLVDSEGEALERRLMCMNLDSVGKFKRPPRKLDYDPYDPFSRDQFDKKIRELDDLLIKYKKPPLPDSYFLPS